MKILIRDSHFGKSEKWMMMMTSLVMLHLKFDLTVNLGDGYIYGSAYFGSTPFKINIQEALMNKIILSSELQIESNLGYALFETEKKRSKSAM
ncbi:MAG: hypothetical protein ACTHKP_15075 [Nitrososphaeraceae archaeon]